MSDALLSVEGLCAVSDRDNGSPILRNVSLAVQPGEVHGLVGESGAGKSTIARAILGMTPRTVRITEGAIILSNTELLSLDARRLRRLLGAEVALIPQDPLTALNPSRRIEAQITDGLRMWKGYSAKGARERAMALLEEVHMRDPERVMRCYPHELSGGMRQRVLIAAAFALEPKLVIADEPTTALDVTVQKQILRLIRSMQERHRTGAIFVTHDLGVVAQICDRVTLLYQGKVMEQGTTAALLLDPQHAYTKALVRATPRYDRPEEGLVPVPDGVIADCRAEIARYDGRLMPEVAPKPEVAPMPEVAPKPDPASKPEPSAQPLLLTATDLVIGYGGGRTALGAAKAIVPVVKNVSLSIGRGEVVGIVGESGSGKTTLGRALLGLIKPVSGSVVFEGAEISSLDEAAMRPLRRRMQMIFQDPMSSLNPRHTIGRILTAPLLLHAVATTRAQADQIAAATLDRVGLPLAVLARYPHEISGGQRQRVGIARAIMLKPDFVLADEIVSGLDVSTQAQVLRLIGDLSREMGLAMAFISHDLSVIRAICNRVFVMRQGAIAEEGLCDAVFAAPKSAYTRSLIDAIPLPVPDPAWLARVAEAAL